ncbi:hypothetical protein CLOSYM_04149 [[Clostridium] symbiosum ATCC 14940]|uniref:Uncharacterized protein n=1 Tax=[Clostridium] symbiosum ATCC 14940 TaxID=411472 RepID=A0ABC9TSP2_CLOSY|nr:hypothetical protein CLOSYM_04149 [[Clostridium] symbiosum ATCC 14940]
MLLFIQFIYRKIREYHIEAYQTEWYTVDNEKQWGKGEES